MATKTDSERFLGIDIGGTKSAALVGDAEGNVLAREEIVTGECGATLKKLTESARRLTAGARVMGCGISCAGPLSSREGLVLSPPNLPGWDRVPIVEMVRQSLGVATRLENDANAGALAEWQWGLKRSVENLVYLTCGTGQGAGIILEGKLYRGRQDLAGEIGHVRLRESGPTGYGKAGSVEGLTSGRGLAELALAKIERGDLSAGAPAGWVRGNLTGKMVGDAALGGDAFAVEMVKELGRNLGHACAMLLDLLNPQRISLGSMAVRLGPMLVEAVRAGAREEALAGAYEGCVIESAALGDRVQDCAALAVAAGVG